MTDYVTARNKLIPHATRYADTLHGPIAPVKGSEKEAWYEAWNKAYHTEMNRP